MEKRLAQVISFVFHPLLFPTYGFILLFNIQTYLTFQLVLKAKLIVLLMIFSSTVMIPMIMFVIYKRRRLIDDFFMSTKEQRIYPYLTLTIIYFLQFLLISKTGLHPIFSFFLLTTTLISLTVFFINLRWKISGHAVAMGSMTAFVTGLSYRLQTELHLLLGMIILCSGIVGFARLKTNSHKPSEVYSGYLVGAVIFILMFLIF